MTETVVGAGAGPVLNAEAPSAAPSTGPSLLSSWLSAFRHGAATVYNDVVKAEQEVSNWRADHPDRWRGIVRGDALDGRWRPAPGDRLRRPRRHGGAEGDGRSGQQRRVRPLSGSGFPSSRRFQ